MNETFDALVIATFGRHLLVRDASGKELRARPFGRGLSVVCGDNVHCRPDQRHGEVHVIDVLPRRTALYRSNLRSEERRVGKECMAGWWRCVESVSERREYEQG